jgi:hypothetical protein
MKEIIINGNRDGKENYIKRKDFYKRNGWTIKDEDLDGCVVERVNRAGYIVQIQLILENGKLYETEI